MSKRTNGNKIKNYMETNENNNIPRLMVWTKAVLRSKFAAINLFIKKKISKKQPDFTKKILEKEEKNSSPKSSEERKSWSEQK